MAAQGARATARVSLRLHDEPAAMPGPRDLVATLEHLVAER
ncbi:hypothetical protein ACFVZM_32590 [Streptomyces sioyaensis]